MKNNISTAYASLSEDALYCLFTEKQWTALKPDQRLSALQEVECRMAKKQGRPVCEIHAEPMAARSMGNFDGEKINLNANLLRSPRTLFGKVVPHGGIAALDTILHEGRHAFQMASVLGITSSKISAKVRSAWAIGRVVYTGGKSSSDFAFYAFQPIERDAREYAAKTLAHIYRRVVRTTGSSDSLFEKGIDQLKKEKEAEFIYVRTFLSEKSIKERLGLLKTKCALSTKLNIPICAFGKSVPLNDILKECNVSNDMLDGLVEAVMDDHRAILSGEKGLDAYMDGLLGGDNIDDDIDSGDSPDNSMDAPPTETLDDMINRLFHQPMREEPFSDSSKVRPDKKQTFY